MNREERLALQLLRKIRVAQPLNAEGHHTDQVSETIDELGPSDYDSNQNHDEDSEDNVFFGDDGKEEEFIPEGLDREVNQDTLNKSRLKLLAGQIWAELGEPTAIVEESAPNELSIRVQDLSWKLAVGKDGRVNLSGFDSGAEQFLGKIEGEEVETKIISIAEHVKDLISKDIDEKSVPPEPPVHFGPEDQAPGEGDTEETPPPIAPEGDQGIDQNPIPPDLGATGPQAPIPQGATPPTPSPGMPPGGGVGAPPPAPGGPPPQVPTASRARISSQIKRVASARLEDVSNKLNQIGVAIGEGGGEVFHKLADRVEKIISDIKR